MSDHHNLKTTPRIPSRTINLLLLVIFAIYSGGRVVSALPALGKPRRLADTTAYLRISRQPVLDPKFWGSTRPLVFPLLLKFVEQDIRRAAAAQLGLSIFAWGFLAWRVSRFMRKSVQGNPSTLPASGSFTWMTSAEGNERRSLWGWVSEIGLPIVAFGVILAFSLDRHIAGWDFVMMTESLSLSFLALFLGLALWLLEEWQLHKVILLSLTGLLLAFTRDTNAWLLLMIAVFLMLSVILRWIPPRALTLTAVFAAIFVLSYAAANLGNRWVFPLGNLIGKRVLTDQSARSYFEECGMPLSPALLRLAGKYANAEERLLFEDPQLAAFRSWLLESGKSCYSLWLISDPVGSVGEVFAEFEGLIAFSEVDKFFARGFDPLLPVKLGKFFYPEKFTLWIWVLTTLVALASIWKRLWLVNPLWAAFILMTLLVPPHLFLTWHGDAMAPERHALSIGVQLYLGFWILILLTGEWMISKRGIKS